MADVKTAAEWQQVADNAQAELTPLLAQKAAAQESAKAAVAAAEAEVKNLKQAARTENFPNLQTPEGKAAFDAARAAVKAAQAKVEEAKAAEYKAGLPYLEQTNQLLSTRDYAAAQARFAEAGAKVAPPDTSTITPPANPQPGSNTEVTTTPTPLIQNQTPRDVPLDPNRPVTLEEIRARGPVSITGLPPAEVQTASILPPNVTTIDTNIAGMASEPFYEVVEPQKTADAYQDEFAGVDDAIAQQKTIDINTSGLPVQAEDGSVASGVLINPETGQTYYTGLQGARTNAQSESTAQNQANFAIKEDWRVRLSLAPNSGYLYQAAEVPGILQPLITTNGVVFPYTPNIQIQYSAHYDNYDLIHSNYKIYQYKNSSVDTVTISCDFTAQDTAEANYLLAVIHFFKSVTKMFYGQDSIPKIGTPPPLCFLSGLGSFQFDNHPLVITNFAYNLPTDVDYIRSSASVTTVAGVNKSPAQQPNNTNAISDARLAGNGGKIGRGGVTPNPNFSSTTSIQTPSASSRTPTYVPTKMSLTITANPIVTRNDISNRFSLRDYATGKLLQGKQNATVGIW